MASFGPGAIFPVTNNMTLEVKLVCTHGGQIGVNVRHYRAALMTGTGTTLGAVATAMNSAFAGPYRDLLSSDASWLGVAVRVITPAPGSALAFNKEDTAVGLRTAEVLPGMVSGIITLQTTIAGRGYRGRVYIPFPDESANEDAGVPTAGYVTDLETLGAALIATRVVGTVGVNDVTLRPVIFHRGDSSFTEVTSARANTRWATQRRRSDYGAQNVVPF